MEINVNSRRPVMRGVIPILPQPGVNVVKDFTWSAREKKVARAAFDLALNREMESVRREVESMLAGSSDPREVWRIHEFLADKREEIDRKYDYRYSVLITVFARLVQEGWLSEGDLSGLSPEKLDAIKRVVEFTRY